MSELVKKSLVKAVLSTGKTVYLREMKISDTEKAAQKVSRRADGDPLMMQVMMKKALVQALLAKIANTESETPRDITSNEKEDMDSLFNMTEYGQLLQVIGKLSGGEDEKKEAVLEFVEA